MQTQSLTYEAECCRRLAAKLKRKEEKRLMMKVAMAFDDLAARSTQHAEISDPGFKVDSSKTRPEGKTPRRIDPIPMPAPPRQHN